MDKNTLRLEARKRRRNLTPIDQYKAAQALVAQLRRLPVYRCATHIAFYIANDGELNPAMALQHALMRKKNCYLPCLTGRNTMIFRRYTRTTKMVLNHYNIPEPQPRAVSIPANKLEIVLMPLVAFDRKGNRLGMGGGFYDRTFAFKKHSHLPKPVLIGLAHSVQEMDSLSINSWDVPMDFVVTEKGTMIIKKGIAIAQKGVF